MFDLFTKYNIFQTLHSKQYFGKNYLEQYGRTFFLFRAIFQIHNGGNILRRPKIRSSGTSERDDIFNSSNGMVTIASMPLLIISTAKEFVNCAHF